MEHLKRNFLRVSIPLGVFFTIVVSNFIVIFVAEFNGPDVEKAFHSAVEALFTFPMGLMYWGGIFLIASIVMIYLIPLFKVQMCITCSLPLTEGLARTASKRIAKMPWFIFGLFELLSMGLSVAMVGQRLGPTLEFMTFYMVCEYLSIGLIIAVLVILNIRNFFFPVKKLLNTVTGMPHKSSFFGLILAVFAALLFFNVFQLMGVNSQFFALGQSHADGPPGSSLLLNKVDMSSIYQVLAIRIAFVVILSAQILFQIKLMISRPLNTVKKGLLRLSSDHQENVTKIDIVNNDEFGEVFLEINKLIEKKQHELASSKGQLDSIVKNAADPIIVYDSNSLIEMANPAACEYFGYEIDELKGQHIHKLFVPQLTGDHGLTRHEAKSKDGQVLQFEANIANCGEEIDPTYTVIVRDISHQLEIEESLKKAKLGAERANAMKSEFLANMSHELRTPLNAVLGFTQILSNDKNLTKSQVDKLTVIGRSGEHLLGLINDILDISKIEAGKMDLQMVDFDLPALVKDMHRMFELKTKSKGLSFYVELVGDTPRFVEGDLGKIRQVLINLIGNAVKFTDEGGVGLTVGNEEGDAPDVIRFSVTDSGRGIPQAEIELITQPFTQSSNTDHEGGTGLGLAISSRYINMMGGQLEIKSKLNEGSVFSFVLPLKEGKAIMEEHDNDQVPIAVKEGREVLVLIVDDKEPNRLILKEMLERVGFSVIEAENGKVAFDRAKDEQPEIIFMDIKMPVMDGYEAISEIRKDEKTKGLKVFALTASAFKHDEERIFASGFDGFLAKPFKQTALFKLIASKAHVELEYEAGAQLGSQASDFDFAKLEVNGQWSNKFEEALAINDFSAIEQMAHELGNESAIASLVYFARTFNEEALSRLKSQWKVL